MQKQIEPCLWFDTQAQEAAEFYVSVFPNSRLMGDTAYPEGSPAPPAETMTVEFELDGLRFVALNGGPVYKFTPAISFQVFCETQEEIDRFWDRFTADGGEAVQCGWVTDKFGVSWQIIPTVLQELLSSPDRPAAQRANVAMLKMIKLDIAELQRAFDGD